MEGPGGQEPSLQPTDNSIWALFGARDASHVIVIYGWFCFSLPISCVCVTEQN